MAASRKRKQAAVEEDAIGKPTSIKRQKKMKAFAGVGKLQSPASCSQSTKAVGEGLPTPVPRTWATPPTEKKRKRSPQRDDMGLVDDLVSQAIPHGFEQPVVYEGSTPRSKRFKNGLPSPAETPSKGAAMLFDELRLDSTALAIPFQLSKRRYADDTSPDAAESDKRVPGSVLPAELRDFLQLYAAFLTALSLYYAHNGTSSPANVTTILPLITKHWKKRSVTLADLRKLLDVEAEAGQCFSLQDYGRGGLCLTQEQPRGRCVNRVAGHLPEEELKARFQQTLLRRWRSFGPSPQGKMRTAAAFVHELPQIDIQTHDSAEKAAPMFARGKQRLTELKAGQAAARSEDAKAPAVVQEVQKSVTAIQSRGTSLLDRILAKQAVTSFLQTGPTKDQLERKAALHRIEDVARVLSLLAAGRTRCSFSLPAIVQHLQQSLRNPISKDEAERCLDLMASEITPAFVTIVQSGGVRGVVVSKAGLMALTELKARLTAGER